MVFRRSGRAAQHTGRSAGLVHGSVRGRFTTFAPDWVATARAIDARYAELTQALARTIGWQRARQSELAGGRGYRAQQERDVLRREYQRALDAFSTGLAELNDQIADFNLNVPHHRLQRLKFDLERERARFDASDLRC